MSRKGEKGFADQKMYRLKKIVQRERLELNNEKWQRRQLVIICMLIFSIPQ